MSRSRPGDKTLRERSIMSKSQLDRRDFLEIISKATGAMVFGSSAMLLAPSPLAAQSDTNQVGPLLKQQFQQKQKMTTEIIHHRGGEAPHPRKNGVKYISFLFTGHYDFFKKYCHENTPHFSRLNEPHQKNVDY